MTDFFTSDLHFGHANIIKSCNRPYGNVGEMDKALEKNWNDKVTPKDNIYIVGDLAFYKEKPPIANLVRKLNGHKYLIYGNHDNPSWMKDIGFEQVRNYMEITIPDEAANRGKQHIVMFHYAMRVWNKSHYGAWHLYGHSHGTLPDDPNTLSIDVGVDSHGYAPVSYEEIKAIMAKKTFKPVDHHGQ